MLREDLCLDVVRPEDVPTVLARAVTEFRKAAMDMRVRWKNPEVGGVWNRIANVLDDATKRVKAISR